MLSELYIKNLAIIEEATIPFSDHFNVFTGETGAGKSILINGINSVLGQRITSVQAATRQSSRRFSPTFRTRCAQSWTSWASPTMTVR